VGWEKLLRDKIQIAIAGAQIVLLSGLSGCHTFSIRVLHRKNGRSRAPAFLLDDPSIAYVFDSLSRALCSSSPYHLNAATMGGTAFCILEAIFQKDLPSSNDADEAEDNFW